MISYRRSLSLGAIILVLANSPLPARAESFRIAPRKTVSENRLNSPSGQFDRLTAQISARNPSALIAPVVSMRGAQQDGYPACGSPACVPAKDRAPRQFHFLPCPGVPR